MDDNDDRPLRRRPEYATLVGGFVGPCCSAAIREPARDAGFRSGPPAEILAWVEALADAVSSVPVPDVRIVAGRKPGTCQNASSAASGVESG